MGKVLNVFFDTETLKVNTKAPNPKDWKTREYVVSYAFSLKGKYYEGVKPNIKALLDYIGMLHVEHVNLLAHNGEGFDFALVRRCLIDYYALVPMNMYLKNSVNHKLERKASSLKGNYLLESHVRAKTRLNLKFKLNGVTYQTIDTLPKFHMSIKTLGNTLRDLGIGQEGKNVKLDYSEEYNKYDKEEDYSTSALIKYCKQVYDSLDEHALDYVMNDTRVMYTGFENYNIIYDVSYDNRKRTLSLNVLKQYQVNKLAEFQLLSQEGEYDKKIKFELTGYSFKTGTNKTNLYDYVHNYYHGGLNMYSYKYNAQVVHDLIHIDLNSSYPSVMRYKPFPTYLCDFNVSHETLELDPNYYYFIEISKKVFYDLILKNIRSKVIRQALIKYLDPVTNTTQSIFLQTPHINIISKFIKKELKVLPALSYLKFEMHYFGGLPVIQTNYKAKTSAKKRGASKGEVQAFKVPLNSVYGVSALRAYFPLYEYDDNGNMVSIENGHGFKNSERNLVFSSSVTAYAFEKLLTPLTYNIGGIDDGFVYADTDSLFLKLSYWDTIKQHVDLDPIKLGAWDTEHKHIRDFYSLNHKKYCLWSYDNRKIEVYSGGIPKSAFNLNVDFLDFIKKQFHDGVKIKNLRNCMNREGCTILYEGITEIKKGLGYDDIKEYNDPMREIDKHIVMLNVQTQEVVKPNDEDSLYYETELGTISSSEVFPYTNTVDDKTVQDIRELINGENIIRSRINTTDIDQQGRTVMELE